MNCAVSPPEPHSGAHAIAAMSRGMVWIGCAAIALMVAATVVDVLGRLVFGLALFGTYDFVQFALIISVYAGMPEASRQGAHIAVDLIDRLGGARVGWLLSVIGITATLLVFLLLTWLSLGEAYDAWRFGETTADLEIAKIWHWAAILPGLAATCITLSSLLITVFRSGRPLQQDVTDSAEIST